MQKLKFLLTCVLTMFLLQQGFSQTRTVTGKVTNPTDNSAIPGATVKVKGAPGATVTDADGNFKISVPDGKATLIVTSIGFDVQEISVPATGGALGIIQLSQNKRQLDEVVVTALGVKREKKALTYAEQTISGDQLRVAANTNFVDALSGKAAGVNIETSNSGAGGSTKAILRGNKSLIGYSEALYVIDGVPLVNNKGGQPGSYGGTDGGDGLSAVNPADIESLTVLRGANASILYGSLGANGVILITTKKGKAGKTAVDFSTSTIFDRVSELPKFQYKYGSVGGDYSWTPPGPGDTVISAFVNGKSPIANVESSSYQSGYAKSFFRTGITETNSVAVHGGNDKTTSYFSYANTSAKGVMPTNTYNKNQFAFNQSHKLLSDKLVVSSNIMFSSEKSHNRPGAGYYNNPLTGLYLFARDRNFNYYKQNYSLFDSARNMPKMNWYSTEEKQNNPFWELNSDPKVQTSNRVIADIKASYEITKQLRFEARGNLDYNELVYDHRYAADGNSVSVSPNGTWNYSRYTDKSLYSDGIFMYNNKFGNLSLNALAGVSYQKNIFNDGITVNNGTTSLTYPNFFSISNIPLITNINQTINRSIKQGVFGGLTLGFKDYLFLDVSARNDWASTLALTGNQSYLYPSVGASAIISQMVTLPEAISFLKVRASISQTANEVPFNVVNPENTIGSGGTINRNTQVPFTNLKPEKIASNEYGTEMRFLKGRIGLEFTVYSDVSTNQFLTLTAPSGSGYTSYYVNAGKITNKGFEFTLDAEIVKSKDFSWKTTFNGSRNVNKIVTLIASDPGYVIGGQDEGFDSRIMAGGSFNDLWIYKFARNKTNQIILDPTSALPEKASAETKVGNVNPDFLLGWGNTVNYKNFFASVQINAKFGGVCFSKTEAFLDSYGVSKRTADARDKGSVAINAILGSTNVTSLDPYKYYNVVGDRNGIMEPYVFSRTNVRLGQLVFGYTFHSHQTNPIFKDASVSLIGRNLLFLYKKAPFDPEQAMSTSNSMQSNDVFSMPAIRSFGFNAKFTF